MTSRTKNLLKNTVILGFGQFLPKLLAIITLPILTAALTTSEYGIYDLILSAESFLLPLMTLQIQQAVFRKLIRSKQKEINRYISSAYHFLFWAFLFWVPIIVFVLCNVFNYSINVSVIIVMFYVGFALFDVFGQTIRGLGKNIHYSVGIVVYSVTNMLVLVCLYIFFKINVAMVFVSSIVAHFIACAFYVYSGDIISRCKLREISKKTRKELLSYSLPIIPSSISLWIVNLSDRLLITSILGTSMNGIYSVANKVPNLFASVYAVFNLAWTETAARAMDKDSDAGEYYSKMFDFLLRLLSGAMLILISVSPIIFQVLVNEQFDESYSQMPILFLGVFVSSIVSFYGGIYVAKQQTKQVGISALIGAILNIIINVSMIKRYGLYAASVSTVISFAIIAMYRAFDLEKIVHIRYNIRLIALCITSILVFCIFCGQRNMTANIVLFILGIIWNLIVNNRIIRLLYKMIKRTQSDAT